MKTKKSKPGKPGKSKPAKRAIKKQALVKRIDSYRDLDFNAVSSYAEIHKLNIDTMENYREAAISCFDEVYKTLQGKDLKPAKPLDALKGLKRNIDTILSDNEFSLANMRTFLKAASEIMGASITKYS